MSEPLAWGELTREQKRALERLWAGGSTRRLDRVSLIGLALMGYVEDDRLTSAGDAEDWEEDDATLHATIVRLS